MINWKFYLNDEEIEEPIGFSEIVFNIIRDEKWHGVMFEASTSSLRFYGEAFDILKAAKVLNGVDADVTFRADQLCDSGTEYETGIEGKLNFSNYRESCGDACFITLSVEQVGCVMTLKNRMEQKVSVDSNIAVDGLTVLQNYSALGFNMDLATQNIPVSIEGSVQEGGEVMNLDVLTIGSITKLAVRPIYSRSIDESIQTSQLTPSVSESKNGEPISPILLLEELPQCFSGEFEYEVILKGSYNIDFFGVSNIDYVRLYVAIGIYDTPLTIIHQVDLPFSGTDAVGSFNQTWTGSTPLLEGQGFYVYLEVSEPSGVDALLPGSEVTFDEETYILISSSKQCPPTPAKVYMVNETLSRIAEAVTNRCLVVNSTYYGRTDSQPFAQDQDGCGGLRVLTSGLRIRQADKEFFASLNEVLEGLKAIDNIGFTIEPDIVSVLRIEDVRYFYQDVEILSIDLVPSLEMQIVQSLVKTLIKVGYKKWEIQSVKGIDEFNSNKEFSTSVKSVNNTLDITSNLISAGYIIDDLRTRSLAATGREDTTYDNDVFIICVERAGYSYIVEQDNIDNRANIFSPETAYNWRIRPMYNLIRWAKSIFNAYPSLAASASKLFFRSGVGNYEAEGELPAGDPCKLENRVLAENDDLYITDADDMTPIWKPETIKFKYPLSLRDYNLIKATPHGYISVQCGEGEFIKAYISSIEYTPATGDADLTLLLKWQ